MDDALDGLTDIPNFTGTEGLNDIQPGAIPKKEDAIALKAVDDLHTSVVETIRPLTVLEDPAQSVFVANDCNASDATQRTVLFRVELDDYRQDLEAKVQDFVRQAKSLEYDLIALGLSCSRHPVLSLQEEIDSLKDEIEIKDRLIATNGEKLTIWKGQLETLRSKQKAVLLPEAE